jgi:hypothetical protein
MQLRACRLAGFILAIAVAPASGGQTLEPPAAGANGETLKERLSDKASDEQRVDNCKVPFDRRGPKPRSSECAGHARAADPSMIQN